MKENSCTMNKLREEILLKIEEMGLLLSKEVRDRVTEERMLRKRPTYQAQIDTTSLLFLWPPRSKPVTND